MQGSLTRGQGYQPQGQDQRPKQQVMFDMNQGSPFNNFKEKAGKEKKQPQGPPTQHLQLQIQLQWSPPQPREGPWPLAATAAQTQQNGPDQPPSSLQDSAKEGPLTLQDHREFQEFLHPLVRLGMIKKGSDDRYNALPEYVFKVKAGKEKKLGDEKLPDVTASPVQTPKLEKQALDLCSSLAALPNVPETLEERLGIPPTQLNPAQPTAVQRLPEPSQMLKQVQQARVPLSSNNSSSPGPPPQSPRPSSPLSVRGSSRPVGFWRAATSSWV